MHDLGAYSAANLLVPNVCMHDLGAYSAANLLVPNIAAFTLKRRCRETYSFKFSKPVYI
jgi:hypothetical protein